MKNKTIIISLLAVLFLNIFAINTSFGIGPSIFLAGLVFCVFGVLVKKEKFTPSFLLAMFASFLVVMSSISNNHFLRGFNFLVYFAVLYLVILINGFEYFKDNLFWWIVSALKSIPVFFFLKKRTNQIESEEYSASDNSRKKIQIIASTFLITLFVLIVFGDHGQLPPINGQFSLMSSPDLKLETVHRQLIDNPIIKVSILARESGIIPIKKFSPLVEKFSTKDIDAQERVGELLSQYDQNTLVLCGYNWTRVKLNQEIRQSLGFEELRPQSGDRVICLRNNHEHKIYNGMIGTIKNIRFEDDDWYQAEIMMDDLTELYSGLISVDQFNSTQGLNFGKQRQKTVQGDLFDFGYALTVHKAQGSQTKRVILFEQRFAKMSDEDWRRWLYTAVTRAEEELYIIGE